jgi:hypothetical protein
MNGAVKIDMMGIPLNEVEILWIQEHPNGTRSSVVANMEFSEVILGRMEQTRQAENREREQMRGAQGL